MAASFFFYDLETSGISPRDSRVMQFAGQRTDIDLNYIGEPVNMMIKLTADVVPEPDAIMVTGITPQSTMADGVTEAEFLQYFHDEIVTADTIFLGFNSVRFDDEFMRYMHYRNYYDAYEWQWCDECSRWDLLDLVRMTRALRPDGINWPFRADGKPTNKLELITKLNDLDHFKAHDALSDVYASIAVAKLIRDKQPGLFKYLMECRGKKNCKECIEGFIATKQPFLYTSGRYAVEFMHTTAVKHLAYNQAGSYGYVYDLRYDPEPFKAMTVDALAAAYDYNRDADHVNLPVKLIKYNRCPAIAPIGGMADQATQDRLNLSIDVVQSHLNGLKDDTDFVSRIIEAIERVEAAKPYRNETMPLGDLHAVDEQLYGGEFFSKTDKIAMHTVRQASAKPDLFKDLTIVFQDKRLQALLPLYKARNFPKMLSIDERMAWDDFCRKRLLDGDQKSRLAQFFQRIEEIARQDQLTEDQRYALEELHLYGESIMPDLEDEA